MRNSGERTDESAQEAAHLVLVVEDDPGVRRLVGSMLCTSGYRALEGVTAARRSRSSAVLAPASRCWSAPVLFMSGYADGTLRSRGLTDGTPRVLRKPFTLAQLSARVEELLGSPAES